MKTPASLVAFWGLAAAWAQPPAIQNAQVETRSAAGGLETAMRAIVAAQSSPAWVGYRVPAAPGLRQTCWDNNYAGTVHLEGPKDFYILYRIRENRIERMHTYSADCVIDAGNAAEKVAFFWLADVKPAESVAYLKGLLQDERRQWDGIVGAIGVHAAPEARQTLLELARTDRSTHVRGQALNWLARTASPDVSKAAITEALAKDSEAQVQRQAVSALAQIPNYEGVPMLLQLARDPRNPAVQKQAMFWLGRSKDERAVRFFEDVLK